MRNTLPERLMRKDQKEFDTQRVARIFASQQPHLALKTLFLLWTDRDMPPALRGSVLNLYENDCRALRQSKIGLRQLLTMAVYGQPAMGHVYDERQFFRHPATHVGMEALGKAMERR